MTGPFAFSVTKYIHAVDIKDFGITLCDTPGFMDNQGVEVDIANGVGVIRALRKCKTVRLVVVFS